MELQPNKRGISNAKTQEAGMPSSGQMSAAGGLLPAQRKQEPFAGVGQPNAAPAPAPAQPKVANGTLNGGAVQGAQLKTTPQPMSPGVASYVSIPSFQPNRAQATGTQLPQPLAMKQQGASFFAPTPEQPYNFGQKEMALASGQTPAQPQQGLQPAAGAVPAPFTPRQDIAEIRDFYNQGGEWDANTRLALQQQMTGDTRAQMLRDAMAGRGSNLGQIAQDRANLDRLTAYEAQRGQLQNQAQQDAFAREMQYATTLNDTKTQLMALASQLGMTVDDADFNKMASELLGGLGEKPSPESMLAKLQSGAQNAVKRKPTDIIRAISIHMDKTWQNETAAAAYIEGLSPAELKACVADGACKAKLTKALDDSWGDDYDRIAKALSDAGIPVWED